MPEYTTGGTHGTERVKLASFLNVQATNYKRQN